MGTPKKWISQNRRQENDILGFGSDVFVMSDHHKHNTEKPVMKFKHFGDNEEQNERNIGPLQKSKTRGEACEKVA